MNLLLLLVRKDLRHSRLLIAATWLAAAIILWLPTLPHESRPDALQWLRLLRYASWVLLYLTIGRMVQLDALLRDTSFLRSRPVSSGQWLASKAVAALVIILPMAFVQVAVLPLSGLRPEMLNLALAFAEESLALGVVTSLSMAFSARSKTFPDFVTSSIFLMVAGFVIVAIHMNFSHRIMRGSGTNWSYDQGYLDYSRSLLAQFIALAGLSFALLRFTNKPLPSRLNARMAFTALATACAWLFSPLNFVKSSTAAEAEAPRAEWPDVSKIQLHFASRDAAPAPLFTLSGGNHYGVEYRTIRASCSLDGVPDDWFAHPNGYFSSLRFPNGDTLQSEKTGWGNLSEELILPTVGVSSPWRVGGLGEVEIGEFPLSSITDGRMEASIEGTIRIPLKRPVILARLPMKAGANARIGSKLFTLTKIGSMTRGRIEYQFTEEKSIVRSRGAWWGDPYQITQIIVVHPSRGEFLKHQSRSTGSVRSGCYAITRHDREETIWRDPSERSDEPEVPADWLDGAELLITGVEYGGTFTREFRFENLNLTNPSWHP